MSSSGVTTSIASNGIVVDVLDRENYSNWKVLVKNYLKGNDLWYNIIKDEDEKYEDKEDKSDSKDNKKGEGEEQLPPKEQPPSKEDKSNSKNKIPGYCWTNIAIEEQSRTNIAIEEQSAKSVEEYRCKKPKEWDMKNRRALHAIQLTCGKTLGQIKKFRTAKKAWDHLKTSFSEDITARADTDDRRRQTGDKDVPPPGADEDVVDDDEPARLLQTWVKKGFLEDTKLAIDVSPDNIFFTSPEDGRTALHVAVTKGSLEIVKKLIWAGEKRLLEMRDKDGYTALALAAKLTDNKDMAAIMVENGGEELLTITSHKEKEHDEKDEDEDDDDGVDDEIPVLLASAKGHKNMTRYLFSKTPFQILRKDKWKYGVVLLARCISKEIFDVAATIIRDHDARKIPLDHQKKNIRPIYALAHNPSAFPNTVNKLALWKRFIYHSILSLKDQDVNNEKIEIVFHAEPEEIERPTIMTHTLPGRLFGRLQQFVQTSILLKFHVFYKMYEEKKDHYYVVEILDYLCKRISILSEKDLRDTSAYDAMLQAAKYGIPEFILKMKDANPELLLVKDDNNRGLFAHAILNRQEEVFRLIHEVENKDIITSGKDTLKYNLLHIAAELGPSSYLDGISNGALQMQRELQWFREVKKVVPHWCHNAKDPKGKNASEVFTDEHKELLKSGQQWAKETASSFTLVGTLIITIMFAAAFTVPGGTNSKDGTPVILYKNDNVVRKSVFTFFVISDAVSLVTSSASVLVFIGILTSRYAEEDFNKSLPLKLLFGLVTLFLSVAAMMCALDGCGKMERIFERTLIFIIREIF